MPSSREHRFRLPGARRTRHGHVMPPTRKQSQMLMMEPPSCPLSCVSQQQLCSCSFCGLELPDNDSVPFLGIWVRNEVTAFLQEQCENLRFFSTPVGSRLCEQVPQTTWNELYGSLLTNSKSPLCPLFSACPEISVCPGTLNVSIFGYCPFAPVGILFLLRF